MLQDSNLTIGTAVANQSGAMEADTISKNGRSLKSHTSKRNLLRMSVLFCVLFCSLTVSIGQTISDLRAAAERGDKIAQFNLGNSYLKGEGVPQDFTQAAYWYRKAADQGLKEAQANLGYRYRNGEGVPKDLTQMIYWWRKAADQGHASSQYNLGVQYEFGTGVEQDFDTALYWYEKSLKNEDGSLSEKARTNAEKAIAGLKYAGHSSSNAKIK